MSYSLKVETPSPRVGPQRCIVAGIVVHFTPHFERDKMSCSYFVGNVKAMTREPLTKFSKILIPSISIGHNINDATVSLEEDSVINLPQMST